MQIIKIGNVVRVYETLLHKADDEAMRRRFGNSFGPSGHEIARCTAGLDGSFQFDLPENSLLMGKYVLRVTVVERFRNSPH
jgi:hypothetical protein